MIDQTLLSEVQEYTRFYKGWDRISIHFLSNFGSALYMDKINITPFELRMNAKINSSMCTKYKGMKDRD